MEKRKQKLDRTLFSHAKLQYCFDNYLHEINLNNNISILTCLMAIYDKVIKIKNAKVGSSDGTKDITKTKWYRYVREAMIEEQKFDIKNYSKMSLQELSETLFNMIVEREYMFENSTTETMFSSEGKTIELDVFVDEGDNTFVNFKKEFEDEVYDWLLEEMHKNQTILTNEN